MGLELELSKPAQTRSANVDFVALYVDLQLLAEDLATTLGGFSVK